MTQTNVIKNKKIRKKNDGLLIGLAMLYVGLILALGSWWLYLIVKYGETIAGMTGDNSGGRILSMVKWEGGTFLTLLVLTSITLITLYVKDKKKTRGLQAFYASMTHELKTPLASMRLQSEVLLEECESLENPTVKTLVKRLIEDGQKMETQMDKILQLSRLEGGGHFHLAPIEINDLILKTWKNVAKDLELKIEQKSIDQSPLYILGDEMALQLIFKNLFENTKNHTPANSATVQIRDLGTTIEITYQDQGDFKGDKNQLGHLFYKHNSKKGSGIGLYLIQKLTEAMDAKVNISPDPTMTLSFNFPKGKEDL